MALCINLKAVIFCAGYLIATTAHVYQCPTKVTRIMTPILGNAPAER